ncbi:MAG: thioredoxin [Clostridia bacterium]|nr:thioredoxin [Clostridia bacterium]
MAHIEINETNYQNEVEAAKGLVLLDFYATWCGPCKMLAPVLDEIGAELDDVKICKTDVDEAMALAGKFNVQSIPTVVLFRDGKVVDSFVGFRAKDQILAMIEKHR